MPTDTELLDWLDGGGKELIHDSSEGYYVTYLYEGFWLHLGKGSSTVREAIAAAMKEEKTGS